MSDKLTIAFFVHAMRSDWNNGNAHFLRGLARSLQLQGHRVTIFEPKRNWSTENLLLEPLGEESLLQFDRIYADLHVVAYELNDSQLRDQLVEHDIVIVHEWNSPALVEAILSLRDHLGFRVLFHDTHHRASSSPEQIRLLQVQRFDGVLAFGDALRALYVSNFAMRRVWTLHEAADTTVFYPRTGAVQEGIVWIGNWGDEERSREIREYLIAPAALLRRRAFCVYGVRYPQDALSALSDVGIRYGGYLPNLSAPHAYATARLTLHIPRQQYNGAVEGIPTIRVFEALASGIPLLSAPWSDTEKLFEPEDFVFVHNAAQMAEAMEYLLDNPDAAREQAARGLASVLGRHTCAHRASELSQICYEVLA